MLGIVAVGVGAGVELFGAVRMVVLGLVLLLGVGVALATRRAESSGRRSRDDHRAEAADRRDGDPHWPMRDD